MMPVSRIPKASVMLATAIAIVGMTVLGGWFLDIQAIVQVREDWAPMQFNTAVCFSLLGIGTVAVLREDRLPQLPTLLGIMVAGISGATLLQYVAGVDLGVDELLAPASATIRMEHTSPQTAATLVAASLTALAYSLQRRALY